jgi:hypothetical protein
MGYRHPSQWVSVDGRQDQRKYDSLFHFTGKEKWSWMMK